MESMRERSPRLLGCRFPRTGRAPGLNEAFSMYEAITARFLSPHVLQLGGGAGVAGICQTAREITAVKLACVPANTAFAFIHTVSAVLYCAKCFMK